MKKIHISLLITLIGFSIISCKKEGCTDEFATNYEVKAKTNNLLCTYEGSLLFWMNESTSDSLKLNTGSKALRYWVQEVWTDSLVQKVRVDSVNLNDFQDEVPECGEKDVPTYSAGLGLSDFRWVKYEIENEFGNIIYSDVVKMLANECVKVQL